MDEVNSGPIFPARLDWPSAIGTFLINFGFLDYLIVDYLKANLGSTEFGGYRERPFKEKLMRIARHLKESDSPPNQREEFEQLLTRLEPVRNLRNHIAHGHLLCHLDPDTKTWVVSISLPKDLNLTYSAGTRHLTFDDLRSSLSELTELIEAFKRLAGFKPA